MLAINIEDIKRFTTQLFGENFFDAYLLKEAEISTANTVLIQGRINASYFEEEPQNTFSAWGEIRPLCFQLIKGKRLPVRFRIILKLNKEQLAAFMKEKELQAFADSLEECFINIKYEDKVLSLTSGVFINTFIMDKSAEKAWDIYILDMLQKENIKYTEN